VSDLVSSMHSFAKAVSSGMDIPYAFAACCAVFVFAFWEIGNDCRTIRRMVNRSCRFIDFK